jgi:uncharacterized membrane protein
MNKQRSDLVPPKTLLNELELTQNEIIRKNISALAAQQQREHAIQSRSERLAQHITDFSGSMGFVYLHLVWFSVWVLFNTGVLKLGALPPFDPFPFGLLTLIVSLEAIFLSTFVLIAQNRLARQSERRAELDLHINLLAEQKAAKILDLLDQIGQQLDHTLRHFHFNPDEEARVLKHSPEPTEVLAVIEEALDEKTADVTEQVVEATDSLATQTGELQDEVQRVQQTISAFANQVERIQEKRNSTLAAKPATPAAEETSAE